MDLRKEVLKLNDCFLADEKQGHAVIGTDLMQVVNDFGYKVLEHEHNTVTFF